MKTEEHYEQEFHDYLNKTYDGLADTIQELLKYPAQLEKEIGEYLLELRDEENYIDPHPPEYYLLKSLK